MYGGSLHECSHGESFFALLNRRLFGQGLYILDEPEAALSPQRQLSLLRIINRLAKDGSQFIIATHSPILLAFPECTIFSFDSNSIKTVDYEQSDPFITTKDFLNNYKRWIELIID